MPIMFYDPNEHVIGDISSNTACRGLNRRVKALLRAGQPPAPDKAIQIVYCMYFQQEHALQTSRDTSDDKISGREVAQARE